MPSEEFDQIFLRLKTILEPFAPKMTVVHDTGEIYYLDTNTIMKNKKPLFFGAVRRGKKYVSYHLMPLYVYPELVVSLSAGLKKQMQGKSCFNFKGIDESLFEEVAKVTEAGFAKFKAQKMCKVRRKK